MLMIALVILNFATARAAEARFTFEQAVEVAEPTADGLTKPVSTPANVEVKLDRDKAYWISAKGKVPVLVLPQDTEKSKQPTRVQLPDVKAWPSALMQSELDDKLSTLVDQVARFQDAVRRKDAAEASNVLRQMEAVARLEYLNFLRASLKFIQGDIEGAKEYTRRGLARYPNNEQGLKFLKALEGKK